MFSTLKEKVYFFTRQIPAGRVTTYKSIAIACGNARLCRVVGNILGNNENSFCNPKCSPDERIGCHRVVLGSGKVGGFAKSFANSEKIRLLQNEGLQVSRGKVCEFSTIFFSDFKKYE